GRMDRVTSAGEDLPRKLAEGPIFAEELEEVAVEVVHTPLGDRLPIAAHDVGPLQRPEARELVAPQQGVDELRSLLRVARIEEIGCLLRRGQASDQVEVDP